MPFGVVSWVGQRMGVLDAGGDRPRGRDILWGSIYGILQLQWGFCGVVILCRDGWRRGSSQIRPTLGFAVAMKITVMIITKVISLKMASLLTKAGRRCACALGRGGVLTGTSKRTFTYHLSSHLISSHVVSSRLISSHLISSHLISSRLN